MYAQDTSASQIIPYPGFSYGALASGGVRYPGFFNKSDSGPIPLDAAKAYLLQAQLITKSSNRINVDGSSSDGFVVLAGRSDSSTQVQVLLNNYQANFDIPREMAAKTVSSNPSFFLLRVSYSYLLQAPNLNQSTTIYPLIQENGCKLRSGGPRKTRL